MKITIEIKGNGIHSYALVNVENDNHFHSGLLEAIEDIVEPWNQEQIDNA